MGSSGSAKTSKNNTHRKADTPSRAKNLGKSKTMKTTHKDNTITTWDGRVFTPRDNAKRFVTPLRKLEKMEKRAVKTLEKDRDDVLADARFDRLITFTLWVHAFTMGALVKDSYPDLYYKLKQTASSYNPRSTVNSRKITLEASQAATAKLAQCFGYTLHDCQVFATGPSDYLNIPPQCMRSRLAS
jgi:hypothetical protein